MNIMTKKMIIENCDKKENIYVFDFINVTIKGQKLKDLRLIQFQRKIR